MSYRRQLANWRSRVPVLSTAGAVPVRTEKGEMYLEKVKVKRYVAGKRPDFGDAPGGGGEADSDYDDDQQVEPHRHQRLSAAAATGDDPFVRPRREPAALVGGHQAASARPELTADPRDRRLQRLLAASSGGARAGRRSRRAGEDDDDDSEYGDEDEASDSEDSEEEEDRLERHRRYRGKAVAESGGYDHHHHHQQQQRGAAPANEDDEEQLDEAELEHRRSMLRMRAKQREVEEELMARQEERGAAGSGSSDAGSDEDDELTEEEYTSDEDEAQPRLKPVFVRRRDRVTVGQGDAVPAAAPAAPASTAGGITRIAAAASTVTPAHVSEERRATTLQLVRQEARQEAEEAKALAAAFDNVDSADEEDDEVAYEAWKLRELKRLKRDREEREARQREQEELQRVRNMTEEERQAELRRRPKIVDNKADKGKYKYLQKYYHRGAFFLDGDNDLLRRDVSGPTLEDHFDKSVLPKVMQVKNFGRAGRTKYTHLVDQDTTGTDNPWAVDSAQAQRFHSVRGGGMRPLTHYRSGAKRSDV